MRMSFRLKLIFTGKVINSLEANTHARADA